MKPIRLHWHGGRSGKINFGDTISPMLVEAISARPVCYANIAQCDLVAVGSLMHKVLSKRWKRWLAARFDQIAIWGTGSLSEDGLRPQTSKLRISAVRGPLTRKALDLTETTPVGDPALLAPRYLSKQSPAKTHRWGIIPHVDDSGDAGVLQIAADNRQAKIIDLTTPDPRAVIQDIASCDFVLSSSLHGLIVADALNIPNVYLKAGDRLVGGDWKFRDYAQSVSRGNLIPVSALEALDLNSLEEKAYAADARAVSRISENLLSAFEALDL